MNLSNINNSKAQYLEIETYFAIEHQWPPQTEPHITLSIPHHYMVWVIDEGELFVKIENQQWHLQAGDVFFAPRRQTRHLLAPRGGHWWSLDFLPRWFNNIDPLQTLGKPIVWKHSAQFTELQQLMQLLVTRWMSPWDKGPLQPALLERYFQELPGHCPAFSMEEKLICQGLAQAILGWCLKELSQSEIYVPLHETLPPWLQRTLALVEENPALSINELARDAAFSPVQLRRLFHRWLGLSPREYLFQRRMDKARLLLEETNWTIPTVAQSVGFSSPSSFTRAFKTIYGMAPAQQRHSSQEPAKKLFPL